MYILWASIIAKSSSSVQRSFFMSGFRWLCHLSRHCFPILPGRYSAIFDQFLGPFLFTSLMTISSSSLVQGPFTRFGLRTFCQRWRHCTSVRSFRKAAMFFQFLAFLNRLWKEERKFEPHRSPQFFSVARPAEKKRLEFQKWDKKRYFFWCPPSFLRDGLLFDEFGIEVGEVELDLIGKADFSVFRRSLNFAFGGAF